MKTTLGRLFNESFSRRLTVETGGPTITKGMAWALVLGLFGVYFGWGFFAAIISMLTGAEFGGSTKDLTSLSERLLKDASYVAIAAVIYRFIRPMVSSLRSLDAKPKNIRTKTVFMLTAVYMVILVGNSALELGGSRLPIWDWMGPFAGASGSAFAPTGAPAHMLVLQLIMTLFAGATEELALVAIPLILFTRLGVSMRIAIPVLVAMRMSFHLYHGAPTMLIMGIWAFLALWMYRRTSSIIPLVIGHSAFDFGIGLASLGTIGSIAMIVIMTTMPLIGLIAIIAGWRDRRLTARLATASASASADGQPPTLEHHDPHASEPQLPATGSMRHGPGQPAPAGE